MSGGSDLPEKVKGPRRVVLLGPQNIGGGAGGIGGGGGKALKEIVAPGPVALVTAGWQERESDDGALVEALGVPAVNLRLHARAEQVFAEDADLATAWQERQEYLRHLQGFYRVRLDYSDDAAHAISVRQVEPALIEEERRVSVGMLRMLDHAHVDRCAEVHAAFEAKWRVGERPVVARHRDELRALLATATVVVISGGHVASLLNRLKLFDLPGLAADKDIVAWSAGAMVLTERIVLFHDHPPYGKDIAQVLDAGFALAPGLVVLPDPRRRIRIDDRAGIARFAQRMAPSTCVAMDDGAHVTFEDGKITSASASRLATTGDVDGGWTGPPPDPRANVARGELT